MCSVKSVVIDRREAERGDNAFTKIEDTTYSVLRAGESVSDYAFDYVEGALPEEPQKKLNHQAIVVRVAEVLPHPFADRLDIIPVQGYQLVSQKGTFKVGDLAVFIQPDSVVPQTEPFKFIWQDHVGIDGTVPEKRRRITVRRFRKEYSEGLLLPVNDFPQLVSGMGFMVTVGEDVSERIGVTHYVPEFDREGTKADSLSILSAPRHRYPKTLRGWFYFTLYKLGFKRAQRSLALETGFNFPVYDVDALKNAGRRGFVFGEPVHVTEKIHGSNGRYVSVDGVFYAGSRNQWKAQGDNVWWNVAKQHPEIEEWCHQNPRKVLYGEVGPTQKGYRYGAGEGEVFFFAFDVYDPDQNTWTWAGNDGFALTAPALYVGPYSQDVHEFADGNTVVPNAGKQIREGIVISSRERRLKLKIVSNAFLEKDSK